MTKEDVCPLVQLIRGRGMGEKRVEYCNTCKCPVCYEDITGYYKMGKFIKYIVDELEKYKDE